jgi:DNA-binding PadR family transcriptional regulator
MSRRPDSFLPLKNDALLIMLAVANEPQHGYGIIRDVEARSDGEIVLQTGALYRWI